MREAAGAAMIFSCRSVSTAATIRSTTSRGYSWILQGRAAAVVYFLDLFIKKTIDPLQNQLRFVANHRFRLIFCRRCHVDRLTPRSLVRSWRLHKSREGWRSAAPTWEGRHCAQPSDDAKAT
jgi:hypothetical protein